MSHKQFIAGLLLSLILLFPSITTGQEIHEIPVKTNLVIDESIFMGFDIARSSTKILYTQVVAYTQTVDSSKTNIPIFQGIPKYSTVRTDDGGKNWKEILKDKPLHIIKVDPNNPNYVLGAEYG